MHAAVAAGSHADIQAASATMGRKQAAVYQPDALRAHSYDALYAEYALLHDYFGRTSTGVMHRLRDIRRRATLERKAVEV
jgi:L-ribulokinase